ncbi:MAG: hypothetical protein RMM08_04775 [Armatimonadota bacterium]|nr:hypothetical protein [bacterium]MDW8320656.1 hypothetical protein [Armatimonadota bacterium]
MSVRAERLRSLVKRHGEDVVVNGTRTVRMVVFVATGGLLRSLFTDNDLLAFNRPMWAGVMAADETLQEGDQLSRDGVSYTVRRVVTLKVANAPALRVAVWSQ